MGQPTPTHRPLPRTARYTLGPIRDENAALLGWAGWRHAHPGRRLFAHEWLRTSTTQYVYTHVRYWQETGTIESSRGRGHILRSQSATLTFPPKFVWCFRIATCNDRVAHDINRCGRRSQDKRQHDPRQVARSTADSLPGSLNTRH